MKITLVRGESRWASVLLALAVLVGGVTQPTAAQERPNVHVVWGDDVGLWNISAYNQGMMGYETPNIDRMSS
jgi:hypothetical protein